MVGWSQGSELDKATIEINIFYDYIDNSSYMLRVSEFPPFCITSFSIANDEFKE